MICLVIVEEREISKHFNKARSLIKEDNTLDALFYLDKIVDQTDNAEVLSSFGLCIALERGKVKDAIDLCLKAIDKDSKNVFHYLNLGKVYLKDGKKAVGIDIFRKGLRLNIDNEYAKEIDLILNKLGTRRKPLLPFLGRKHFVNKYCGIVLRKLGVGQ
jgi:tetratricopeptide (TPR) repeat protein